MLYFKHSELVKKYHISLKTVHNWIDAAKEGKLDLMLYEHGTRTYIANNPSNLTIIENQVSKGKKYRNSRYHKVVTPAPEFYHLYTPRQILDIISSINIHREIPRQYNYMDGGATNWNNWLERLEHEQAPNILNSTIELMRTNLDAIDLRLEGYTRINVVDIGVGNARPVKELLTHLLDRGLLHRYIAIDISESMLQVAKANIQKWFGGKVKFEGFIRDITYERFDDVLIDDMVGKEADKTINLVLLLGATSINFRVMSDIFSVVYGSMADGDLLVCTNKPDTEAARSYFDFNPKPGSSVLSPSHRFILDLMNIDESLYEVEMGFNKQIRMRFVRIKLKTPLTIQFKFDSSQREVSLEKGDTILMLRVWHKSTLELIAELGGVGFMLLHSSLTKDREYQLTIHGVEAKASNQTQ